MEFTYDGLVRQAFGFQNPNHAAALFCLALPWLWAVMAGRRPILIKIISGTATLALLVMLALTYSRTGMMVLLGEAVLFAWLCRRERRRNVPTPMNPGERRLSPWLGMGALVLAFAVAAVATGAATRLTGWITNPDRAFTNRFSIWRGGLELFGVNPGGVGMGHSGLLYTSFLAPEDSGIATRTLVNSFLTVLVEQGAAWGVPLLTAWLFAVWSGWRGQYANGDGGLVRIAALTALAGGVVSGTLSTCFDLSVLARGAAMGFTTTQIIMSWLLLAAFAVPLALLWLWAWRGGLPRPGRALIVLAVVSLTLVATLRGVGRGLADGVRTSKVIRSDGAAFARIGHADGEPSVVLYDNTGELAAMVRWTRRWMPGETVYLSLSPWHMRTELPALSTERDEAIARVVLQGKCGYLAEQAKGMRVTLVSPPMDLPRPEAVDQLFLRKYAERPPWPLAEDDPLRIEYY